MNHLDDDSKSLFTELITTQSHINNIRAFENRISRFQMGTKLITDAATLDSDEN